jgi:serine/threonine-protein kinase RsbW
METCELWEVPADPAMIGPLRRLVAGFATAAGVAGVALGDVRSCVSEAAANVVMHAFRDGRPPGTISVAAELRDGELVVTVSDDGMGFQPRTDSPGLGVGLPTIAARSRWMSIDASPAGGTALRMAFALAEGELAGGRAL